jgi:anti-sigma factor RsiW
MTVKPTVTPDPAPHLALDVIKSGAAGMEPKKKPAPAPARAWTWTRIVRYVSLYYLVNVIGNGITIEGFRRLVSAGDTDLAARGRATGIIAAGNLLRMVAASAATILCESRRWEQAVVFEFFLETIAVALYVHFTMDAFGCSCPCPHQC